IKKEEAEFSIDDINKACDFFRKTINNLNTKQIEIDYNLRDNLILAHKKNPEYSTLLEDDPSITYAINYELLRNEEFRTKGLGSGKIKELFKKRGWNFKSGYISTAMARNADRIKSIPNPKRK